MSDADVEALPGQPARLGDVLDGEMKRIGVSAGLIIPPPPAEVVKRHLPLVTVSALKAERRCKREYYFGYELRYRSIDRAGPLVMGTGAHNALESWWTNAGAPNWIDIALAAIDMPQDGKDEALDPFQRAMLRAMIMGYHVRWQAEDLEVLGVERQFEVPLVNPATGGVSKTFRVGGKIDAIARCKDGRIAIVEHKTTSEDIGLGSTYWKRLKLDPQISTYFTGAEGLGFKPDHCLYDVIRKPGIRPFKATPEEARKWTKPTAKDPVSRLYANQREYDETPEEFEARCLEMIMADPDKYYMRGEIPRLVEQRTSAAYNLWENARSLRDTQLDSEAANRRGGDKLAAWYQNPDACIRYGRPCDYFDVCVGEASLQDPTRFRRSEKEHEELAPAPAAAAVGE